MFNIAQCDYFLMHADSVNGVIRTRVLRNGQPTHQFRFAIKNRHCLESASVTVTG
jgi:hypothetical protein